MGFIKTVGKVLAGILVFLSLAHSSYELVISGKDIKNYYKLRPEQREIVDDLKQKIKTSEKNRKQIIKDYIQLNKAIDILEAAKTALSKGERDKCLNLTINAKGILSNIKSMDTRTIETELLNLRKTWAKKELE